MDVLWRDLAEQELMAIVEHVMLDNPPAAVRLYERLSNAAKSLADFPERFRSGAEPESRELVVPGTPYIIVYRVAADTVEIVAVFHAAQDKPRGG